MPFVTRKETWGYSVQDIPSQKGKTIIITGANTGLGFSSAKILAKKGAKVILACRSKEKCQQAVEDIRSEYPKANVYEMVLDLSSLQSVKKFAKKYKKEHSNHLDSLMLNAGVMSCPYALTADGIESQFGVNHVAHHYLTKLLLPLLNSNNNNKMTHIVSVSSSASFRAYNDEPDVIKLTLEEINDKSKYHVFKAYGQSKLSNILFVKELQERYPNIMVTAVHPGAVRTELGRHIVGILPNWIQNIAEGTFTYLAKKGLVWLPDDAALSQLFAMSSPKLTLNPNKYRGQFIIPLARIGEPPIHAYNKTLQKKLWSFTEKLIEEKVALFNENDDDDDDDGDEVVEETIIEVVKSRATFAAGCFWSVELAFQRLPGVLSTSVGYIGGNTKNPTYNKVASGQTGHAEAVEIVYNENIISYNDLLTVFFEIHDSSQLNRQGHDIGTQYRSLIVAHNKEQYVNVQERMKNEYKNAVTELLLYSKEKKTTKYYKGETYHQQYLEKGGQSSEKGNLNPIQCYGNRGPIKNFKQKIFHLYQLNKLDNSKKNEL